MANCSIPNSNPMSGRISMKPSRRSKRSSSRQQTSVSLTRRSARSVENRRRRHGKSVLWPTTTLKSALHTRKIKSAICKRDSTIRRVKGAWWPSRSSKPSSPRKWRGRFDSYPLRHFISNLRFPIAAYCWSAGTISGANGFQNRKLAEGR